eukprot:2081665-Lingulodinium_polyedra.AAC.1
MKRTSERFWSGPGGGVHIIVSTPGSWLAPPSGSLCPSFRFRASFCSLPSRAERLKHVFKACGARGRAVASP